MDDLPKEISYIPVPYIALVGLDAVNNPNHNLIWNNFAINRAHERPSLYYKLISADHKFPVSKNRKTYDQYIPNGIIKKNWLSKHLFEIPSVVVIFEEANCDSLHNQEVRLKCVERIKSIRSSLFGRQVKICLILLQSSMVLPDDSLYKDAASRLCSESDINPKSLFIIPMNESQLLTGYILRIENAILELAHIYYANKAKLVKSHKDQLVKPSQIMLFVRHEFKLGFFHEIRQIYNTALGHYKCAYVTLVEIPSNSDNIFEIKSIASLINYKICRLSFNMDNPVTAISHFKKHIEIFQTKLTSNKIEFENFAWLSKQYYMFGELFEMIVNLFNLSVLSIQYPGIYFFESAMYLKERRRCAQTYAHLKTQLTQEEINTLHLILEKQKNCEYIGQIIVHSNELDNLAEGENLTFKALQYNEQFVDHTALLITLYINVLNQCKKFKKPRFMKYIMFLLGEEYYNSSNYNEALTYLTNILPFYRDEKWETLYYKVLHLTTNCAFLATDLNNFIRCGFEITSTNCMLDKEKLKLLNFILSLLDLKSASLQLFEEYDDTYNKFMEEKWSEAIKNVIKKDSINEININLEKGNNLLECKAAFSSTQYYFVDHVDITVAIYSFLPIDLENLTLHLKFENSHYNQICLPTEANQINVLKANSLNKYSFQIKPILEDLGKKLHITGFSIQIGTKISVFFNWFLRRTSKSKSVLTNAINNDIYAFDKLTEVLHTKISDHESNLDVEVIKNNTIFMNENAILKFKFTSNEKFTICNLHLTLKTLEQTDSVTLSYLQEDELKLVNEKHMIIEKLIPGQLHETDFIFSTQTIGNKSLSLNFSYDLLFECDNKTQFILVNKLVTCDIESVQPFAVLNTICNLGTPNTANIRVAEPFRLYINFSALNDEIEIARIVPYFANNLNLISQNQSNQFPCLLSANSNLTHDYLLSCSIESSSLYSLGYYEVEWSRKRDSISYTSKDLVLSKTIFQMPSVTISPSLIFVELQLPEKSYARNPIMAKYIIHNRLDVNVVVEINMVLSENFMASGNKSIKVNIPGKLFIEQRYIFFPMQCGLHDLPKLGLTVHLPGQKPIIIDYVNQMITSVINVFPQIRTCIEF